MIVGGELDDVPEQAFYMVGPIGEVLERAKKTDVKAESEDESVSAVP